MSAASPKSQESGSTVDFDRQDLTRPAASFLECAEFVHRWRFRVLRIEHTSIVSGWVLHPENSRPRLLDFVESATEVRAEPCSEVPNSASFFASIGPSIGPQDATGASFRMIRAARTGHDVLSNVAVTGSSDSRKGGTTLSANAGATIGAHNAIPTRVQRARVVDDARDAGRQLAKSGAKALVACRLSGSSGLRQRDQPAKLRRAEVSLL
jgi:hypothetical protein